MSMVEDRVSVQEMLPFWVNGTLSADEAETVENAIADGTDFAAEVELLAELQRQIKSDQGAGGPGEFGLARLMRDIDRSDAGPKRTKGVIVPAFWGALVASIVAFGIFVSGVLQTTDPVFVQASGGTAEASIGVIFQRDLDAATLSARLYDLGLTIVDGPSAAGVYHVAPIDGTDLAELASALETQSGLFEFIESVE